MSLTSDSAGLVRQAIEGRIQDQNYSDLDWKWENVFFDGPKSDRPYAAVYMMFAEPFNNENSSSYREQGYAQVSLFYPVDLTSKPATDFAGQLRALFPRKTAISSGGLVVQIDRTPSISPAIPDGDRFQVVVKIPFFSQVTLNS